MFDQSFASPTPSSLCRAERVKTPPWFGRGESRGAFPPLAGSARSSEHPRAQLPSAAYPQDVPAGRTRGWWCPLVPAPALTLFNGRSNVAARCGDSGTAQALAGAARRADVPRGSAVTFPALPVPTRALRGHRIPKIPIAPALPTLPGTGQPINNKGNR